MALSQDEQRKLEAIEDALLKDDPTLARAFSARRHRHRAAHLAWLLGGMTLMLAGPAGSQLFLTAGVLVAVGGYLVMIGSVSRWFGRRSV